MDIPESLAFDLGEYFRDGRALKRQAAILDLSDRTAASVIGRIRRTISSGQGTLPYEEALEQGSRDLMNLVELVMNEDLVQEVATAMFQSSFDMMCAKYGDPFSTLVDIGLPPLDGLGGIDFPGLGDED
jgi:hypothetical protein